MLPTINFDEHIARFLFVTVVLTLVLTQFTILSELFVAALLSIALLVLYTSFHAFRLGYLEGKLNKTK